MTWDKAHLVDNGGIFKSFEIEYTLIKDLAFCKPAIHLFKSFEIEYTLIKDLAFCKPAIHLNPLLINFWVLFVLALFEPSKGAK